MESLRILAVDDEPALLNLVTLFLTRQKHRVTAIGQASIALSWFKDHRDEVDLAFLDLTMPEMPGEELARALFQIRPELRILLSSGYPFDVRTLPEVMHAHTAFLAKPYVPRDLEAAIRQLHRS